MTHHSPAFNRAISSFTHQLAEFNLYKSKSMQNMKIENAYRSLLNSFDNLIASMAIADRDHFLEYIDEAISDDAFKDRLNVFWKENSYPDIMGESAIQKAVGYLALVDGISAETEQEILKKYVAIYENQMKQEMQFHFEMRSHYTV